MNKVLVGVPCMDIMRTRTAFALINLEIPKGSEIVIVFELGADVARNRNKIVKRAIDDGFTHVLFIDSDMLFDKDILTRMLNANEDILGVVYNKRMLPVVPLFKPIDEFEEIPNYRFEVEWVGTGVMLIKTEVFKTIGEPCFMFQYTDEYVGEDIYFCRKAREAGYQIMIDPKITVKHLGELAF